MRSKDRTANLRIAALVSLGATACIPLSQGRVWDSRIVTGKLGPDKLVSTGGASCMVSTTTLLNVQVGDKHRCIWFESTPRPGLIGPSSNIGSPKGTAPSSGKRKP
jgi:hypothetical protein